MIGNGRNMAVDPNGQCIGGAVLQFQKNENWYSCERGYWLGEKYWGKGIACDVVALLKEIVVAQYQLSSGKG